MAVDDEVKELIHAFNNYTRKIYGSRFLGCSLERKPEGHLALSCKFDENTSKEILDHFFSVLPPTLKRIDETIGWSLPEVEVRFVRGKRV